MRIRAANIPHRVICNKAVKVLHDRGQEMRGTSECLRDGVIRINRRKNIDGKMRKLRSEERKPVLSGAACQHLFPLLWDKKRKGDSM